MFLVLNLILTKKQKFGKHGKNKKKINIKNRTYYFYNDQIDSKDLMQDCFKLTKKITMRLIFIILVM